MTGGGTIYSAISVPEIEKLTELARGRRVLEIGSAYGYSAVCMAMVAEHVTAIDPHAGENANSWEVMTANLDRYDVAERVSLVRGYSQDVLPTLLASGVRYGLVFVDGNHTDQVHGDVQAGLSLLEPDGWLAVHDYGAPSFPAITAAVDELGAPHEIVGSLWVGVAK
jgi:predicted O-methyltransferase YrrM